MGTQLRLKMVGCDIAARRPWQAACFQNGGCLYDLSVDENETNDLFADPKMAGVVKALSARLAEAGASGPPWAHPASAYTKQELESLAKELCAYESKVGYAAHEILHPLHILLT